ncbi:MAG: hypothetical protein RDA78_02700 [Roseibium sp.]|uniref:hypothetical protein n=1 Tax=Roseibium sp. TaxID=1936156 RepID=UPI003D9C52C4
MVTASGRLFAIFDNAAGLGCLVCHGVDARRLGSDIADIEQLGVEAWKFICQHLPGMSARLVLAGEMRWMDLAANTRMEDFRSFLSRFKWGVAEKMNRM